MNGDWGPSRRAKLAVAAVSGGLLAMIWSCVWYAAVSTGRGTSGPNTVAICRAVFIGGLVSTILGAIYLRRRKLSVIDGSTTHAPLQQPGSSDTHAPLSLQHSRL